MTKFSELGIGAPEKRFVGEKIKIRKLLDKPIVVEYFTIEPSRFTDTGDGKRLRMQLTVNGIKHIVFTSSTTLKEQIQRIPKDAFPVETVIKEDNESFIFT